MAHCLKKKLRISSAVLPHRNFCSLPSLSIFWGVQKMFVGGFEGKGHTSGAEGAEKFFSLYFACVGQSVSGCGPLKLSPPPPRGGRSSAVGASHILFLGIIQVHDTLHPNLHLTQYPPDLRQQQQDARVAYKTRILCIGITPT